MRDFLLGASRNAYCRDGDQLTYRVGQRLYNRVSTKAWLAVAAAVGVPSAACSPVKHGLIEALRSGNAV